MWPSLWSMFLAGSSLPPFSVSHSGVQNSVSHWPSQGRVKEIFLRIGRSHAYWRRFLSLSVPSVSRIKESMKRTSPINCNGRIKFLFLSTCYIHFNASNLLRRVSNVFNWDFAAQSMLSCMLLLSYTQVLRLHKYIRGVSKTRGRCRGLSFFKRMLF